MGIWLIKSAMDELLKNNCITREELAAEFEYRPEELFPVLDGEMESGEELENLLVAAFGIIGMFRATDWNKTEDDF